MTPKRSVRIVLLLFFVALLATPLVLKRLDGRREAGKSKLEASQALTRYGFHFQEVAQVSGISFVHQAPTLDRGSITSCRRLPPWAPVLQLSILIAMVGRTFI